MIRGGITGSFKRELLEAIHNLAADQMKIALYDSSAQISPETAAYVTEGEISGLGYEAGGRPLLRPQIFGPAGATAYATWDDPIWPNSTLMARGALIYNQSKGQRSVAVLDFGFNLSSNSGDFRVQLPPAGPTTALVTLK